MTIHNIEFQGQYDKDILPDLFGMGTERYEDGTVRMAGCFNWLKTGILYADQVTIRFTNLCTRNSNNRIWCKGLDGILRMVSGSYLD